MSVYVRLLPKRSKEHVLSILNLIREYRKKKMSEAEIKHTLALNERTWRRYIAQIHQEDKAVWLSVTRNELEGELLNLKSSLENTYSIANEAANDNKKDIQDRLLACEKKDDARLSIVQLLTEGPDYVNEVDSSVNKQEQKMDTKSETAK